MAWGSSFLVSAVPVSARSTVLSVAAKWATPAVPTASVVTVNTPTPATSLLGSVERGRAGRELRAYTVSNKLPARVSWTAAPGRRAGDAQAGRRCTTSPAETTSCLRRRRARSGSLRRSTSTAPRLRAPRSARVDPHPSAQRGRAGRGTGRGARTAVGPQRQQRGQARRAAWRSSAAPVDRATGQLGHRDGAIRHVGRRFLPGHVDPEADDHRSIEAAPDRLGQDPGQLARNRP